ncbi:fibronectin type III domain-containing protein, partial [Salmonella sp. s51228]|uniref:fibronectin type III domain-containing protein n=1 Tax=Salmonella sp. s51228 TaxID=3159652 RepID=UPI00398094E3
SYTVNYTGITFDDVAFNVLTLETAVFPDMMNRTLTITGLEEFEAYIITVFAINNDGTSDSSVSVIVRTLSAVPSQSPQNVTLTTINSTVLRADW